MDRSEQPLNAVNTLKNGQKNLSLQVIVLEHINKYNTKEGHEIRTFKVADKTGSVNMCVWDELGAAITPGDICRISRGYSTAYKGSLTLYVGRGGKIFKIGEFCLVFSETPNMSDKADQIRQQELEQQQHNVGHVISS